VKNDIDNITTGCETVYLAELKLFCLPAYLGKCFNFSKKLLWRQSKWQARKSYFSIVEIALALAIVGLGMASILALFPVGLSASRNAISNTLASQVAEEFMSFIKAKAELNTTNYDAILAEIPEQDVVGELKNEMNNAIALSEDETSQFLRDFKDGVLDDDSDYTVISKWGNIYRSKHPDRKFVYIILQRAEDSSLAPDFSAAVLIYKAPLDYAQSGGGTGSNVINWTPPMTEIMALHVEVSWPLNKVYRDRDKRNFYTIIKRP
jgi:hypothetical protein